MLSFFYVMSSYVITYCVKLHYVTFCNIMLYTALKCVLSCHMMFQDADVVFSLFLAI